MAGNRRVARGRIASRISSKSSAHPQNSRRRFDLLPPRFSAPIPFLRYIFEDGIDHMRPGDILLLHETQTLRSIVDPAFFAILACPHCGKRDLITQSQYSGTEPVICGYNDCSCHFRIGDRHDLLYLLAN